MSAIEAIRWSDDGSAVRIVDQRQLPAREIYRELHTVDDVRDAIATLAVRGAPAIGIAGAMGIVLAVDESARDSASAMERVRAAHEKIRCARPTAVNLAWAADRMLAVAQRSGLAGIDLRSLLRNEATRILDEDRAMCRRIGDHGASLIPDGARIAVEQGKRVEVFADETRPLLQGSRLTAWELERAGIPVTVLVDGAAASLMRDGAIDLCIVGADRIAANGDVANKVGTLPLAIAARYHDVPFYVAAPMSTVDAATRSGRDIVIEQRAAAEVSSLGGGHTAPDGVAVYNPAFDVTAAELITAIITDRRVERAPYDFAHTIA